MQNVNESGRSMVEMLGVLAIIGVLSVGGIAGYTHSMKKYRANELANVISMTIVAATTNNASTRYTDAYGNNFPQILKPVTDVTVTPTPDSEATLSIALTKEAGDCSFCETFYKSVGVPASGTGLGTFAGEVVSLS